MPENLNFFPEIEGLDHDIARLINTYKDPEGLVLVKVITNSHIHYAIYFFIDQIVDHRSTREINGTRLFDDNFRSVDNARASLETMLYRHFDPEGEAYFRIETFDLSKGSKNKTKGH